ncbi:thioredoxin family protein [Streptomyces sp. SR27]|uniref:DF family (seleno)protein n=1 Tax=Streptomyces sp. SR27 TaxID=3076630 RepID=UPI00295AEB2B|nr:thioredoxin family protein [Streptomyces sp. SR27]MDV9191983.1 thioredoxin family protein [Streptomyces sp. SR27]
MDIELLYFAGCPNWHTIRERLDRALVLAGHAGQEVTLLPVETEEQARAQRFPGSPTIRVDGRDPFPVASESYGLTCRVYATPEGLAGSPTVDALVEALADASKPGR